MQKSKDLPRQVFFPKLKCQTWNCTNEFLFDKGWIVSFTKFQAEIVAFLKRLLFLRNKVLNISLEIKSANLLGLVITVSFLIDLRPIMEAQN